ncbi:MAG: thymidine phosphorylase, partial [Halocynthiibacter sp.]
GRLVGGAKIDPSVGLSQILRLGERVETGDVLLRVHAAAEARAQAAEACVRAAFVIGDAGAALKLIGQRISQ